MYFLPIEGLPHSSSALPFQNFGVQTYLYESTHTYDYALYLGFTRVVPAQSSARPVGPQFRCGYKFGAH